MPPSPIFIPRHKLTDPSQQEKIDPLKRFCGLSTPTGFAALVVLLAATFHWSRIWLISGAPILTYCVLLGAARGARIAPHIPLWTQLASLNLVYSIAVTSWLLYGVFAAWCYPAVLFSCLFQFESVADLVRGRLRAVLKHVSFVDDKIALFNIPALEIDTDVDGLFVVRGMTLSLSSLTVIVHGVELGIKLSHDMEMAIQVEKLTIAFFRRIEIGDVYSNLKGGAYEMTFHDLAESTKDEDGDAVFLADTPLLRAATGKPDASQAEKIKMKHAMTDGAADGTALQDSSALAGLESVKKLSPDHEKAAQQYKKELNHIHQTNAVYQCRRETMDLLNSSGEGSDFDHRDERAMRAAICSRLHDKPTVPHPPQRSIRVTTLQNLAPPRIRRFLHRLPMLLRLLLAPLTYFHPISINSITTAGSGKWIRYMLGEQVFKDYADDSADLRRLERRISNWLANANFVLQLADVTGLAQVPFVTSFDIIAYLGFGDVMAYRTGLGDTTLKQVIRLGGADATITLPSFLLPHHEHILPPTPTKQDEEQAAQDITDADGLPKTIQAEQTLKQVERDETNMRLAVHASLPACFDQELLDFIAALVKATKVVEMEKEPDAMDDISGIKDFARKLNTATKDGMKKAVVGGIVNDKFIAKMVGKITKKLETAQGDVGWAGNLPVALDAYRPKGVVASKLLA